MPGPVTVVPARGGRAVRMARGAEIEIINPSVTQVVDTWAVCPPDGAEHMSMEHTRVALGRLVPRAGDALYSNGRRALLTLVADTSPGVHDTLMASCDAERYRQLGAEGGHASCAGNFAAALRELRLVGPPAEN